MAELIVDPGAVRRLPAILSSFGSPSCLVVSSGSARATAMLKAILPALPVQFEVYSPSGEIPLLSESLGGIQRVGKDYQCVIAIGGGRIIDTAKAMCLGSDCLRTFASNPYTRLCPDRVVPLIAVPTIAGSGSEVTPFAIAYMDGLKYSLFHPRLRPVYVLADLDIIATVPGHSRTISGIDSVAHGIEAMLSNEASSQSNHYARVAIAKGLPALTGYNPGSRRDDRELCLAAWAGGEAIARTRTTVPHALSYFFTSRYAIPHGQAVCLTMGLFLRLFEQDLRQNPAARNWKDSFEFIASALSCSIGGDIEAAWLDLMYRLGIEINLEKLGIDAPEINEIDRYVNPDRMSNSPANITLKQMKEELAKYIEREVVEIGATEIDARSTYP